jgi:hypothetical protein
MISARDEQMKGGHYMLKIANTDLRAVPFVCAAGNSLGRWNSGPFTAVA